MTDSLKTEPLLPTSDSVENNLNTTMISNLLGNAKAAIFGAIELHNKPIFPSRYEVTIILTINAWEMALKAFIIKFHPETKIFEADGKTKPFDKCLSFVERQIGKDFLLTKASVELLYKYRCDIIHFFGQEIETILYSILRPNIIFFSDFLVKYFEMDLSEEANLIILPVGFKRTITPIDFLSKKSISGNIYVQEFIDSIKRSAKFLDENDFEDGLVCNYSMIIEKENNVKNADIVVGVTQDANKASYYVGFNKKMKLSSDINAQPIKLDEQSIFKDYFNLSYKDFIQRAREEIKDLKTDKKFTSIMNKIKADENCFRKRCLDIVPTPKSVYKPYYSELALTRLKEEYAQLEKNISN